MSKRKKAVLYIIFSALCFSTMNIFVRLSGDIPSIQKSFFRNFVAVVFAFAMLKKQNISFSIKKENLKYLLLRSILGTIGILCNFYAVDHLAVADASLLNKLSPFFVILFSFLILHEKIKIYQGLCMLSAFVGVLFIVRPSGGIDIFPSTIGVLGGMCAGAAYTFVRMLSNKGVKGPMIIFFFSAFSCLVVLPVVILNYHPMTINQILILLLAGVAATGGQIFITLAYSNAPAREISVYDYTQIIFSMLLSIFILNEYPENYSYIGYIIVVGSSIVMYFLNQKNLE